MSIQTTRAHRRPTGAQRFARALTPLLRHLIHTPAPVGPAALADSFTPCSMELPDGYMPQRPPTYLPVALRQRDRVRIVGLGAYIAHRGLEGVVGAIEPDKTKPVVVDVPDGRSIFCDEADLVLLDRPTETTLVMDAVDDMPLMGGVR